MPSTPWSSIGAVSLIVAIGAVQQLRPAALGPCEPSPAVAPAALRLHVERGATSVRVVHAAGLAVVPRRAARVCALAFADELLCLGLTPVAVQTDADGMPADYLADRLVGVLSVRTSPGLGAPDLAAVAASDPQLILTTAIDRRVVDQLERIAPTVVLRQAAVMYRENGNLDAIFARLDDLARLLEREDEALRFRVAFDRHFAALRQELGPRAGRSIAFFRTHGREWRLYGHRGSFGGEAVFRALGLAEPTGARTDGITALDPERLIGFDTDYLIVVADPTPGAAQSLARIRRHALWPRIAAVQNQRVHEVVVHRHWVLSGPIGKLRMADDIAECLRL